MLRWFWPGRVGRPECGAASNLSGADLAQARIQKQVENQMKKRIAAGLAFALLGPLLAVSNVGAQADVLCDGKQVTIFGTSGDDIIVGTGGDDVIFAMQGDDRIEGGRGDDTICAGQGDDLVIGGEGFDIMFGAQGDDVMLSLIHI